MEKRVNAESVMAPKKRGGRPSKYTKELADKICQRIANGESERKICSAAGMPSFQTLNAWKAKYPDFLEQSARARMISADLYDERAWVETERVNQIAEDAIASGEAIPKGVVEAKKLYIQECRREAGLRDDSRFGDRKRIALTGADGGAIETKVDHGVGGLSSDQLAAIALLKTSNE